MDIGDRIRITDKETYCYLGDDNRKCSFFGKTGTITRIEKDQMNNKALVYFAEMDEKGLESSAFDGCWGFSSDMFKVITTSSESEMKIGDRVRVTDKDNLWYTSQGQAYFYGEVGTVIAGDPILPDCFGVRLDKGFLDARGEDCWWFYKEQLEVIAPVQEPKTPFPAFPNGLNLLFTEGNDTSSSWDYLDTPRKGRL